MNLMEQNTNNGNTSPVDDLDAILSGYKQKMEVPVVPGVNSVAGVPGTQPNTQQPTPGTGPLPNNTPFSINRDANANTFAPQEFYVRGPKKGQPKPPRKIYTPTGQQIPATPPPQNNQLALNTLISGAMFITLIDLLIPLTIAGLNNLFNKKVKLEADKLKMTQSQRNDLSQIGEAVVKELKINAPHWVLLLLALFGIYGFNAVLIINQTKQQQNKKDNEKNSQSTAKNDGRQSNTVNSH